MTKTGQVTSRDLPIAAKRYCVVRGYAMLTEDGKVRYDWDKLYHAWIDAPGDDLSAFARHLEIPYGVIAKRHEFSVVGKRALRKEATISFRRSVIDSARILSVEHIEAEAERVAAIVDNIEEIANLGAAYARQHMTRRDPDGSILPNVTRTPKDVKLLVEMGRDCAAMLVDVFELRKQNVGEDEDERIVNPKPRKVSSPNIKLAG